MKKIYLGLIAILTIFTACTDVDLEPMNSSEAVTNLHAEYTPGSRQVTLKWTNPTMPGQTGIQIIKDDIDVINVDGVVDSYFIKKALEDKGYPVLIFKADPVDERKWNAETMGGLVDEFIETRVIPNKDRKEKEK